MGRDPAILFYTSDFLTATMTWSDEQVGKYIRLLCLQHQKEILTERDMMFICKSYNEDIFSKFIKTETGKYYNKRMNDEILRRKEYSASRSLNRKSNKDKPKNKENHMLNICNSYDEHMETETITEDINEIKIKNKEQKFKSEVYEFKQYPDAMLKEFISYWTEPNKSKTKLRYELQQTWDLGRRLNTWARNNKDFKKAPQEKKVYRSSNFDNTVKDDNITPGEMPASLKRLSQFAQNKTIKT